MNLEIAEASQGMNVEISQTRQGIKLELAFGLTQTKADARYASQTQVTTLTTRIATAEAAITTLDGQVAKEAIKTIRIGNVNVTATLKNDTIIITAAGGIDITGNAATKTITIDTSWLKQQIVNLQSAAATNAFVQINCLNDDSKIVASSKTEEMNFGTIKSGSVELLAITANAATKTISFNIKKLESVLGSLATSITDEASARNTAIAQAIASEVSNRNSAIATAVQTETTARQTADTTLQQNINSETTARQSADTTLQQNINTETTTRQTADTNLQNGINTLTQALSAEETRAKGQEQTNAAAITAEATARQTADAAITAALGETDGKVVLNDEIAAAILANLNGRIAAIEESIKNGFAGLTVDNLFVKAGMRSYFFNGDEDDDALVVVRPYAPNIIPKHYGQRWFDTVAKKWYKPQGITSVSDWVVDN